MTRKGGRPHKKPKAGERVQLSFRITASLKRRLVIAGKISGRSQSQEAELRIEQSFWMDDLIRARLMRSFPAAPQAPKQEAGVAHDFRNTASKGSGEERMSDTVDSVAMALWLHEGERALGRPRSAEWSEWPEDDKEEWRGNARAAIAAMYTNITNAGDMVGRWQAMIDSALSVPPQKQEGQDG